VLSDREGLAQILLASGADAHAREWICGGLTPLGMARTMGYYELAELLKHGVEAWYA